MFNKTTPHPPSEGVSVTLPLLYFRAESDTNMHEGITWEYTFFLIDSCNNIYMECKQVKVRRGS